MSTNKKTTFSMSMTESQRDILETVIDLEYPNLGVPKASYLLELLRIKALSIVDDNMVSDYVEGRLKFTDEQILELLKKGVK